MASSLNNCNFTGNLGRDPEMSYNPSGNPYTRFSVAINNWDYRQKSEVTMWMPVFVSGKRAETCNQYLKSGSKVAVSGRLTEREWTDDNGIVRKAYSLMAEEVIFLGNIRGAGETQGEPASPEEYQYHEGKVPF